eukprot:jgi/Chlat1/2657/Chrsp178S02484
MTKLPAYRVNLNEALGNARLDDPVRVEKLLQAQGDEMLEALRKKPGALARQVKEIGALYEVLRSVSDVDKPHAQSWPRGSSPQRPPWKVAFDSEGCRVLQRSSTEGSPLQTLCVEGLLEGPLLHALCVGYEAPYFPLWQPSSTFPKFAVTSAKWIRQFFPGQALWLENITVQYPLAPRDLCVFTYIVPIPDAKQVLFVLRSVPHDLSLLDWDTEIFTKADVAPPEKGIVRMELSGGVLLHHISDTLCAYRTITHLDMKLDHVPPAILNFISRQLAPPGHKLFDKQVKSLRHTDKGPYHELLSKEQLYLRIKELLYGQPNRPSPAAIVNSPLPAVKTVKTLQTASLQPAAQPRAQPSNKQPSMQMHWAEHAHTSSPPTSSGRPATLEVQVGPSAPSTPASAGTPVAAASTRSAGTPSWSWRFRRSANGSAHSLSPQQGRASHTVVEQAGTRLELVEYPPTPSTSGQEGADPQVTPRTVRSTIAPFAQHGRVDQPATPHKANGNAESELPDADYAAEDGLIHALATLKKAIQLAYKHKEQRSQCAVPPTPTPHDPLDEKSETVVSDSLKVLRHATSVFNSHAACLDREPR